MSKKERKRQNETFVWCTLNLSTSSILAVLPEVTQVWKKEGATLPKTKKNVKFILKLLLCSPHSKRLWGHVGPLCLAVGGNDPECAKEKNQQVLQHDVDGVDDVDDVGDVCGDQKETCE